jgi:HrpA-like RNA helicase
MLRAPLDRLILQVKATKHTNEEFFTVDSTDAAVTSNSNICMDILQLCPDPPTIESVCVAVGRLKVIQALKSRSTLTDNVENFDEGDLTALGFHLSLLPCAPNLGRLLIYGALLGCLKASSCIAASLSVGTGIFLMSSDPTSRQKVDDRKVISCLVCVIVSLHANACVYV